MFSRVSPPVGNYPINTAGGDWKSFVMEIVLTTILVTVILNTTTGYRSIGHNAAHSGRRNDHAARPVRQPHQRRVDEPGTHARPRHRRRRFTGWWVYVFGPLIGATIAVMLIGLVRGLPDKEEREAAEGGALPLDDHTAPPK